MVRQFINDHSAYVLDDKNENVANYKLLVWGKWWQKTNMPVPKAVILSFDKLFYYLVLNQ